MGNGTSTLDREGCEYGRSIKKDLNVLKEDVKELKEGQKSQDQVLRQLEKSFAAKSWEHTIAVLAVNAILMGIGFYALISTIKTALGG